MAKAVLYRLLGAGRIPKLLNENLRIEGIVISDEGIAGSATYRDFRAPGRYSSYRKQAFVGSVVVEYRYQTSKPADIIKWIHSLTQT